MIYGQLSFLCIHILGSFLSFVVISSRVLKIGLRKESENTIVFSYISPWLLKKKKIFICYPNVNNFVEPHKSSCSLIYCLLLLFLSLIYYSCECNTSNIIYLIILVHNYLNSRVSYKALIGICICLNALLRLELS